MNFSLLSLSTDRCTGTHGKYRGMERDREEYGWKSVEELGAGPDAEKALAESIRAKVCGDTCTRIYTINT